MFRTNLTENDFTIDKNKLLGRGVYGSVHGGTYENKEVAIKISPIGFDMRNQPLVRDPFKVETHIIKKIASSAQSHAYSQYVLSYYGYGKHPLGNVLIAEYADAGSLKDWIFKESPINWYSKYSFLNNMVHGLCFLHELNILHCDVKPDNILIKKTDDGYIAKWCDFGLSKIKNTRVDQRGSLVYMSPEVLLCIAPNSEKSDIFGLAIVLWEMSTHQPITNSYGNYNVNTLTTLTEFIAEENRVPIPSLAPEKIAKFITWGWKQQPQDRPSAQELATELETDIDNISPNLKTK